MRRGPAVGCGLPWAASAHPHPLEIEQLSRVVDWLIWFVSVGFAGWAVSAGVAGGEFGADPRELGLDGWWFDDFDHGAPAERPGVRLKAHSRGVVALVHAAISV